MRKYFIISDIHSQHHMLRQALLNAGFDMDNDKHHLIIVGDILDRGKQGNETIKFIEELIQLNRVESVVGNHDQFLIDILNDNIDIQKIEWNIQRNGFGETLKLAIEKDLDFIIDKKTIKTIVKRFKEQYPIFTKWIVNNPLYLEFNNHVLVHGFLDFELEDWHNSSKHTCIWERGYNKTIPDSFNKKIIMGHTPNYYISDGVDDIIYDNKKIMIDGGAASKRQINVLVLFEDEI
jgi:serine/threonine protein phosphatase 1